MFGIKKRVLSFCMLGIFALAITVPCSFADIVAESQDVYDWYDFADAVNYGVKEINIKDDLKANGYQVYGESYDNLQVINGNGYDIDGDWYGGIVNTGNLKIISVGQSFDGGYSSNGFSNFSAWGNSAELESVSTYEQSSVPPFGGAILNGSSNANLQIADSVFSNNEASFGGAIVNFENAILSLDSVTFKNNYAEEYGGAIVNASAFIEKIANSKFMNNEANEGGAILNGGYIHLIDNVDFVLNSARQGGAISNYSSGDQIAIKDINANFLSNKANEGGAIYNSAYIDTIKGKFEKNSAQMHGGAIYNTYGSATEVSAMALDTAVEEDTSANDEYLSEAPAGTIKKNRS